MIISKGGEVFPELPYGKYGCSFALEAKINEQVLIDHVDLKNALQVFGKHLCQQLDCDVVEIHSLNFSKITDRTGEGP